MEYIISLSSQTKGFLFSIGFGVIIGVLYDLLRVIRLTLTKKRFFILIFDIVFVLTAAVLSFLFFLTVAYGEVRLYIIFGELLGFLIYYFSFGVVAVRFCEKTADKIKHILKSVFRILSAPFVKIYELALGKLKIFGNFLYKLSKKSAVIANYHLKKYKALLYNLTVKMRKFRVNSPDGKGGAEK